MSKSNMSKSNMSKSKTGCGIEAQLSEYLDGYLDGASLRRVAAHLDTCEPCRAELQSLRRTKTLLAQMKTPSAPPNEEFWVNAYRTARLSVPARRPSVWESLSGGQTIMRRAAPLLVAALAAAALVPAVMLQQPSPGLPAPAAGAQTEVDVMDLVRAHTQYAAVQPLSDSPRLSMVLSEEAARNADVRTDTPGSSDAAADDDATTVGVTLNASGGD